MKGHWEFQKELEAIVSKDNLGEVLEFMEKNIVLFFSSPDIPVYYKTLRQIDISSQKSVMPILMMAWMAFLSGDHSGLFSYLKPIDEDNLKDAQQKSTYYALKAFVESMMDTGEALRYAKLSIEVLPEEIEDFYMANAKLTYGQLLSGTEKYRDAAVMFEYAYKIFDSLNIDFLAAVAIVNEALNRLRLGEFTKVIDKCNNVLLMASSYTNNTPLFWNIVHLPLGMCYYEMNKPRLGVKYLTLAKECLDKFELFHMHGLVELYLFKAYLTDQDKEAMEKIRIDSVARFGHMHYRQIDLLLEMFKVFCSDHKDSIEIQRSIEVFEIEYSKMGYKSYFAVIDTLVFLKLKGLNNVIKIEDLEKRLERLRFIGNISEIQLTILQLSQLYFIENRQKEAFNYLKEAVNIYKEFGICACFFSLPFKSMEYLKNIDNNLYEILNKVNPLDTTVFKDPLLSPREKEIMRLIACGKTNDEMGKALFISVGTIKWHINNIFGKLAVKNRVQAIEKAKSLGEI